MTSPKAHGKWALKAFAGIATLSAALLWAGYAFSQPPVTLTRGEFAVLLQQKFALQPPAQTISFPDVKQSASIYNAVQAAAPYMNPMVLCPGCALNRNFFPNQPITRGISTIALVRILAAKGKLQFLSAAESNTVLLRSPDGHKLPPAARPYFATAISHKIIAFLPGYRVEIAAPNTRTEINALVVRLQTQFKLTEPAGQ